MSESLHNLKTQLLELDSFLATGLFRSYKRTYEVDITEVEANIINTIPADPASVTLLLQLHERRSALQEAHTFFETAQAKLKERIAEMEDAQSQAPDNEQ